MKLPRSPWLVAYRLTARLVERVGRCAVPLVPLAVSLIKLVTELLKNWRG